VWRCARGRARRSSACAQARTATRGGLPAGTGPWRCVAVRNRQVVLVVPLVILTDRSAGFLAGQVPPAPSCGPVQRRPGCEDGVARAAGHGVAESAPFGCPRVCRHCYLPKRTVQARQEVIVTSRVCRPATRACPTTRFETSSVLAGSNRRRGSGRCGMWHAIRHTRRRVPPLADL